MTKKELLNLVDHLQATLQRVKAKIEKALEETGANCPLFISTDAKEKGIKAGKSVRHSREKGE